MGSRGNSVGRCRSRVVERSPSRAADRCQGSSAETFLANSAGRCRSRSADRYRDSLARTFARTSSGAKCVTTAKTKTPPDQKDQEDADIKQKTTTVNFSKTSFHSKLYIQHADLPAFRIKISLE